MSQSQETPASALPTASKSAQPKRSILKIIGIGCLSIVICMVFAGAILIFSGVLSGTPGNRNDHPTWSPDGSSIAFQSDRRGNTDIYLMDPEGSRVTQLTRDLFARLYFLRSASDEQPAWSPDGNRIAFISGRDNVMMTYTDTNIYVMDKSGSNLSQLTGAGSEEGMPSWSSSGKQIVYSSRDIFTSDGRSIQDATWDIYVINVDGSNPIQLTNDPANELEVAWSPDEKHIAFISDRNGHDFDIYIMNADGSNVIQLTSDSGNEFGPAWSPDSSRIAFSSDHNGNVQLYVMNADGSEVVQLTNDESNSAYPSWSPDGNHIVFESDRDSGNADIFVMKADGSDIVRLSGK